MAKIAPYLRPLALALMVWMGQGCSESPSEVVDVVDVPGPSLNSGVFEVLWLSEVPVCQDDLCLDRITARITPSDPDPRMQASGTIEATFELSMDEWNLLWDSFSVAIQILPLDDQPCDPGVPLEALGIFSGDAGWGNVAAQGCTDPEIEQARDLILLIARRHLLNPQP